MPRWLAVAIGLALGSVAYGPISRAIHDGLAESGDAASPYDDELVGIEVRELAGTDLSYRIALPASGWRAFARDYVAVEAPRAEHWLRRSDVHAELMVLVVPGSRSTTTLAAVEAAAVEQIQFEGFELMPVDGWALPHEGHATRYVGRVPDVGDTMMVLGHWLADGVAYRVLLTVPPDEWEGFAPEARAILAAFDPGSRSRGGRR